MAFWKLQLSIIGWLRLIRSLSLVVAVIIPGHDGCSVRLFAQGLTNNHWKVSSRDISFVEIGNSIANTCTIIIAVHSSSANVVEPILLTTLPAVPPKPIAAYLWEPFNRPGHSDCFGREDADFNKDKSTLMVASAPKQVDSGALPHATIKYNLHRVGEDANIHAGSSVLSTNGLCPPFEACPNRNLFQHLFGIEFHHNGYTYVRAISSFEFARCFNLVESIQYCLSHKQHKYGLDASMPAKTSA
jgi:hypothetical protein